MRKDKLGIERLAQGLCSRCGKKKVVRGVKRDLTTFCKECLKKKNSTARKYVEKKFPHLKALHEKREKRALQIQEEIERM